MAGLLISISGKLRNGKDTAADFLVREYGFKKMSWADTLKAGVNAWHGWGHEHAYGALKEVVCPYWGYTPRYAYQRIGTELMRDQWNKNFWVLSAMRKIDGEVQAGCDVVIADTRFPNEAEAVRAQRTGAVWRVVRPDLPNDDPHPSETSLDDYPCWDAVIVNDSTVDDLHKKVADLFKRTVDKIG